MTYEYIELTWARHLPEVIFSLQHVENMQKENYDQHHVYADTMLPLKNNDFYEEFKSGGVTIARLTKPIIAFWVKVVSGDDSALGETVDAIGLDDFIFSDEKFLELFRDERYSGKHGRLILAYEVRAFAYKYGDREDDYEYEYHPELLGTLDLTVKPPLEYEVKNERI